MGFGGVHRHARFAHDMFAGGERGQGDRGVEIGPGADDDGVGVTGVDEFRPGGIDGWDVELGGDALR